MLRRNPVDPNPVVSRRSSVGVHGHSSWGFSDDSMDGNLTLMEEILHQLIGSFRFVYKVLYIPDGAGFFHQQSHIQKKSGNN